MSDPDEHATSPTDEEVERLRQALRLVAVIVVVGLFVALLVYAGDWAEFVVVGISLAFGLAMWWRQRR